MALGSSFHSAVNQVVERRIRSGRTDVRVRFEIMPRIKKDRIANGLDFVWVDEGRRRRVRSCFPVNTKPGSVRTAAHFRIAIGDMSDDRIRPRDLPVRYADCFLQFAYRVVKGKRGGLQAQPQVVESSQDAAVSR